MSNYNVLFSLRLLKSILITFVDSFLVLYFLELSDSNILPLGIYKLVAVSVIFLTIFLLRNLAKSKYRVSLLRIGIVLDFVYFLTIILLKEKVVDYMYLVGILYGLEEGFYFSVYNCFETDGVKNEERAKFIGMSMAAKSILAVLFPVLMGSYIFASGFLKAVSIVLIIVAVRIILSFQFKDMNVPVGNKTNFKEYMEVVGQNTSIRKLYKLYIYNGLTYSEGAFASIVMIYIIKVFSNSFSLGIFTSIFSGISCLVGILFARLMKPENYSRSIKITTTFTVIALLAMIANCNTMTIVLFNFLQTISRNLTDLVNNNNESNLSNIEAVQKKYKVEFFVGMEFSLFVGRTISQVLLIMMAFMENAAIMMTVFTMLLILYELNAVDFNDEMEKTKSNKVNPINKLLEIKTRECEYE